MIEKSQNPEASGKRSIPTIKTWNHFNVMLNLAQDLFIWFGWYWTQFTISTESIGVISSQVR